MKWHAWIEPPAPHDCPDTALRVSVSQRFNHRVEQYLAFSGIYWDVMVMVEAPDILAAFEKVQRKEFVHAPDWLIDPAMAIENCQLIGLTKWRPFDRPRAGWESEGPSYNMPPRNGLPDRLDGSSAPILAFSGHLDNKDERG